MRLQYHAHSCFSLYTSSDTHILIDPYLNDNPLADVKAQDLSPDVVLVTHGHDDHLGDAVYFGQKGALIISTAEIIHYLSLKGLTNLHPMQVGGGYQSIRLCQNDLRIPRQRRLRGRANFWHRLARRLSFRNRWIHSLSRRRYGINHGYGAFGALLQYRFSTSPHRRQFHYGSRRCFACHRFN